MSVLCDIIAKYIEERLDNNEGATELCRSELASSFGCAPSQITYVLRTRFSPGRGYRIESRRGGGGYIRVQRVDVKQAARIKEAIDKQLDGPMSRRQAEELVYGLVHTGAIDSSAGQLMLAAVSDSALRAAAGREQAASIRTAILSQMLLSCVCARGDTQAAGGSI